MNENTLNKYLSILVTRCRKDLLRGLKVCAFKTPPSWFVHGDFCNSLPKDD